MTGKARCSTSTGGIGRFRVLHQAGAGTCGPDFRAMAPDGYTPAATKPIPAPLAPGRARRAADRFAALADAAPRMSGLAAPLEAGLYAAQPYLVTTFAPGDALDVALRQFGPAALPDLVPRLGVLARVLDAAAAAGIAHGALHPRDVLVAEAGTELTGLGVWPVLVAEGLRLPIRRPYRAPEVADGILDAAGDRYALAALAFEWMTGRRVAPGAGFIDVPSMRGVEREAMADLFTRALHDDPDERFASAGAFVSGLAALAGDAAEEESLVPARSRRRGRAVAPMLPLDAAAAGEPDVESDAEADAHPDVDHHVDDDIVADAVAVAASTDRADDEAIDDGLPLNLAPAPDASPAVELDGDDAGRRRRWSRRRPGARLTCREPRRSMRRRHRRARERRPSASRWEPCGARARHGSAGLGPWCHGSSAGQRSGPGAAGHPHGPARRGAGHRASPISSPPLADRRAAVPGASTAPVIRRQSAAPSATTRHRPRRRAGPRRAARRRRSRGRAACSSIPARSAPRSG